ncbi:MULTISPECIES: HAD-IIIC family phosphatase [unclassified Streptomyces]|uniref:HAD-IIIC family phosphatase n=1 Tax=unclassified Streptomyces TaxID=2593676 RepID=UPI002557C55C|nr:MULTISPECIES: HAD-IIIC family phosphatase [unclassified Streptomyces]WRZ66395.1 HAD-IIIC family phosphatase [Streptomyces sp. NBC_01257]WSU60389.1 HAD-IIIC family phosphatase [Streptomyces sp. NBC_01104]
MTAPTAPRTAQTTRADAAERLRALHDEGRIAAEYPRVPGLLAEIAQAKDGWRGLSRAGGLLARTEPGAVRELHPGAVPLTAAVTGHGTLDALGASLTAELARHGVPLRLLRGEHDSWLRDLRDTGSPLYAPDTELALCLLDAQIVFDELPAPWGPGDVSEVLDAKLRLLTGLVEQYMRHGSGVLVLNTLPLLTVHTRQLVDHRSRTELSLKWREFNTGLLRLALDHPRVHVIDLDPLIAESGPVRDSRLAAYAGVHLGEELLARYAREIGHLARAVRGRTKKVLVVDLDNTLWDGILGDDGPGGIAAATTYRGAAFGAFQQVVKQIGSQGVLLAVCSKNDRDAVIDVLRDHPDMRLREADFVAVSANWEPKDGNLRAIAERLNLGVDSLVFADDSPFECGLVAANLPDTAVVRLDEEPALHIGRLLADGWFDTRELTDADRDRAGQYRADAGRRDLLDSTGSMDDYLRELDVRVDVSPVRPHELARIAQITLRTNQFNLTTQRLQKADVQQRLDSPDHLVLAIRTGDRFGDNGVVGALFAHRDEDGLHLDNVLLSCRVFARGIEQAALAALLDHARETGAPAVHGSYLPTAKNHKVRDFLPSLGFETTDENAEGHLAFRHSLAVIPQAPGHVTLDVSFRPGPG